MKRENYITQMNKRLMILIEISRKIQIIIWVEFIISKIIKNLNIE